MSWTVVQSAVGNNAGSNTNPATATLGSSVTAGNLIVILAELYNSAGAGATWGSVGDNKGNPFTRLATENPAYGGGGTHATFDCWIAPALTGGSGLIATGTPSLAGYANIFVAELTFAGLVPTLAGSNAAGNVSSGLSVACGNVAVSGNDIVLGVANGLGNAATWTAGGGYTIAQQTTGTTSHDLPFAVEYLLNTSTNPAAPTLTVGANQTMAMAGYALAEAAASYTLTGPTTGATGVASTNFTVTPNGTIPLDTITFSDGAGGGTFTPTSLSFSNSSTARTFTYTPASTGVKTLTLTSGKGTTVTGSPATYTATATYTLTGPTGGLSGSPSSNFTLTPSGTITSDPITLSDGAGGGTFTPTSLTFTATSAAKTFTYTPNSTGVKTLTVASGDSYTVTGSPWTYTSSGAVSYTVTGPSSGFVGVASTNFTVTPATTVTSDTVTPSDGGQGGTFNPTSLPWSNSSAAQTFTYTPATIGAKTITLTSADGGLFTPATETYTAYVAATGYTFSGASSAIVGVTSAAIYLTPNGQVLANDSVALSDGGAGGTFTPASLSFSNTSAAKSFTYENSSANSVTISAVSTLGLAFTPATWAFTVLPNTTIVYQSFVSGLPAGYASTATVTPQVFTGTAMQSPAAAFAGTVVETAVPGSYWCEVTYHTTDLVWPSVPSVNWSVNGQTLVDPAPKGRQLVDPAGLDPVMIELGINLPQAVAIIAAACAGQSSGVAAGKPIYQAAGNPATTRITAVAVAGDRSTVSLTLPGI